MRAKVDYRTISRECYNNFIARYPQFKDTISYDKYKEVLYTCNNLTVEFVLKTGNSVRLPYGFGDLTINRKKLKRFKEYDGKKYVNLRIDWQKTKAEGKRIYHTNEHSDGYNYKWFWRPKTARIANGILWVFKPHRDASRAIAKFIKKPNSDYKDLYREHIIS